MTPRSKSSSLLYCTSTPNPFFDANGVTHQSPGSRGYHAEGVVGERTLGTKTHICFQNPAGVSRRPVPPSAIGNVSGHGTTIVGDGSGVAVVHASTTSTAARPVLSGGIFKQQ